MKDADHLAVWMYILLNATHGEYDSIFGKNKITLKPGQLITGRKIIARTLKISESKVERILKAFCSKTEHQIEQQTSNRNRLITIVNWDSYQKSEQQNELQVNNKRTTSEQQVNTYKNVNNTKKIKNVNNNIITPPATQAVSKSYKDFIDFFNEITGRKFKYNDKKAALQLQARLKENYTREEFKTAIENVMKDPYHKENNYKWLTPEFITRASKLEMFLNAPEPQKNSPQSIKGLSFGAQEELLRMKRKAERETELARLDEKYQQPLTIENNEK